MNNKGFAISGIIYTILIIFIIILFALLGMFNSRKNTLDKLKDKVLNTVGSNIIIEDVQYNSNDSFKAPVKGYYELILKSSNGSILSAEIYLKESEYLYFKIANKTTNLTEIFTDDEYKKTLLNVSNDDYNISRNSKELMNINYTKKTNTISNGSLTIKYLTRERKNESLNRVRFIKNCISGNALKMDLNNINKKNNKWNEIKAIVKGINVAQDKNVKLIIQSINSGDSNEVEGDYSSIVDDNLSTTVNYSFESETKEACVIIDLERTYSIDYIESWHNYSEEPELYEENKMYVSTEGIEYTLVDNSEITEYMNGNSISVFEDPKVILVGQVYVPVKQFDGATWMRLYHHNNLSGIIKWEALAQLISIDGYDTLYKKSILYNLDSYKNSSNQFELLLEYPDNSDKYNRWIQTSNFVTSESITGFKTIKLGYPKNFTGLKATKSVKSIITANDGVNFEIGSLNPIDGIVGENGAIITGRTDLWIRIK